MDLVTSMTFGQILLEVAERVGKADYVHDDLEDNRATIPEDPHDLDKLKRCVNNGYSAFCRAYPRWRFLEHPVTLTIGSGGNLPESIDADPARYRLPASIGGGQAKGNWRYEDRSSPVDEIVVITDTDLDRMRQASSYTSGTPRFVAHRRVKTKDTLTGEPEAWEAVFYPVPGSTYTINCVFRIKPPKLVELEQRHICGADHDLAIIAYAVWGWKKDDATDPLELGNYKAEKEERLRESMALDSAARSGDLGKLPDASPNRTYTRSLEYTERQRNGVPLS